MTGIKKWLLAAALAAVLFPAAAHAQYPYAGYGVWGQMNYGQGVYVGTNRIPPYFALHPPVYYSHVRTRRPMGMSPFAYPSWYAPSSRHMMVVAAEAPAAAPLMITNPYVGGKAAGQASNEIINPHVASK